MCWRNGLFYGCLYIMLTVQSIMMQRQLKMSELDPRSGTDGILDKFDYSNSAREQLIGQKNTEIFYLKNKANYDTPDDCHFLKTFGPDRPEVTLTCNLRTVNSDFDTTNFSVIPSENTVSLNILCNNDLMAKSSLESRSFAHLIKLKQLTILYCKINRFSREVLDGLEELQNLTIKTNNVLWPTLNFEIEAGSFGHLKKIARLDLSSNNIWSLPENIFCPLGNLMFLNLSENRLQDINELGFRDHNVDSTVNVAPEMKESSKSNLSNQCSLDLQILDVSFNHFVLLPTNGFGNLRRLRKLKLNNNEISMIADKALSNLKDLEVINLSSNKIVALPSEFFQHHGKSLQEIYLNNNSISVLSPKLFSYLNQLRTLDLSRNQISSTWIDYNTFLGLIRLVLLNLSHNKITRLEPKIFTDLYTLQILNLQHNQIGMIAADTFAPMNNLHTLLLSYNNLKFLDAYALDGLFVLSHISLDNNALAGIHPDALRNCSSLQELNLNANHLDSVPLALRNLSLLRTLDLGENKISFLDANSFKGLENLYGLRLIGNLLENITSQTLRDLPNLEILNLSRNRIKFIETGAFDMTKNIQAIRLDSNQLNNMQGLFTNMPSLLWLNMSDNCLPVFDYVFLPLTLQWLDLHKNNLTELSNQFGYERKLNLQTIDASFNRITKISSNSIPNSIKLLFLNDNLINVIEPDTFIHKTNLTRVDLYANQISSLDIKSLRIMPVDEEQPLPEFYIGGNPFTCDCNIDWLQKINQLKSRQYPYIVDLDGVYCKLLNIRENIYISLREAEPKHFLCTYKAHCFTVCHCCEFDACDCEMTCPTNCTCFHDQTWTTNIVDCSRADYAIMPRKIPMDTTELYIDGNNFTQLFSHTFLGRKNLVVLYINNSNIHYIYNTTFSGLKRLTELHLENNKISRLNGLEFLDLESLQILNLQNNCIEFIGNGTFQYLRKLKTLKLDGNSIVLFEVWLLALNPLLNEITLSNNRWSCECSFLMRFRNFLVQNSNKIFDAERISCIYNNLTSVLSEEHGTKCTLREDVTIYVYANEIQNFLPMFMTGICTLVGCLVLICGICCYRNELRLWAHENCISSICYRPGFIDDYNDQPFVNDAYFAYSLQDDLFVNQILSHTLENEIGYRLCLHYRDNNVINSYASDSIIEAAERAKQFVIILSKNFLYNEWTRYEYKNVLNEMAKRRKRLVFILYGDLPQRDIDMDMRNYLRTNTCIEWDDKKFWHKLRLALPIKSKRRQNGCFGRSSINLYSASHVYQTSKSETVQNHFKDCSNYAKINDCRHNYATIPTAAAACKYKNLNELANKAYKQELDSFRTNTLDKNYKHDYSAPIFVTTSNTKQVSSYDSDNFNTMKHDSTKISNICNCRDASEQSEKNYFPSNCSFYYESRIQSSVSAQVEQLKCQNTSNAIDHSIEGSFYCATYIHPNSESSNSSNNSRSIVDHHV